jgi:hypothetical protein
MCVSPVIFWILYQIANLFDHPLHPEARNSKRR